MDCIFGHRARRNPVHSALPRSIRGLARLRRSLRLRASHPAFRASVGPIHGSTKRPLVGLGRSLAEGQSTIGFASPFAGLGRGSVPLPPITRRWSRQKGRSDFLVVQTASRARRREVSASEVRKPRWCRANSGSPEFNERTPTKSASFRNQVLKSRTGTNQQVFKAGTRRVLQTPPLLDRHQNGSLDTAPGHDLGALLDCGIQQLAETSLRILHLPRSHRSPPWNLII